MLYYSVDGLAQHLGCLARLAPAEDDRGQVVVGVGDVGAALPHGAQLDLQALGEVHLRGLVLAGVLEEGA